ncbi:MAG: Glu/Leu/Phe/Val dehydrogenase dimerization domain-containing protein [Desulfobacteraceae bacterium]|jgi:leucine dehydrogenase
MESLLKEWDGEEVIIRLDRPTGAWIIIAIHQTRFGPARGGTRMKGYPDLEAALRDALSLARSMSYKFAVADFSSGGGKAVVSVPENFQPADRDDLLRRYGTLVRQLGGLFETGPDVGTTSEDMDTIAETGAPYIFCRTPAMGGAGGPGRFTALGVFSGIEAVCEQLFGDESLAGRRVLVQGAGAVGGPLIGMLRDAGAEVLFSDVDQASIRHFRDVLKLPFISTEAAYDTPCDIFSPCALGAILNKDTIARLKCLAVAGGANNQLAELEDAERLHKRGILYAPDYAMNIGGAMGVIGIEAVGWSHEKADEQVKAVKGTIRRIFEDAKAEGINPDMMARRIAEARLSDPEG